MGISQPLSAKWMPASGYLADLNERAPEVSFQGMGGLGPIRAFFIQVGLAPFRATRGADRATADESQRRKIDGIRQRSRLLK
jgi:hypothetical protein